MPRLVVISGSEKGREFVLKASQTIGRLADNDIPVSDSRMSRQNTRIVQRGSQWFVEDMESKNGTVLNGAAVKAAPLADNDEVRVGETYFSFLADEPVTGSVPPTATPADIRPADLGSPAEVRRAGDDALRYSRYAGENTKTSFLWLRQDLGQRDGAFRALLLIGLLLVMAGIFWLIQMLVAGS